jgi:tetratricopeptide (TPR) repeat protein
MFTRARRLLAAFAWLAAGVFIGWIGRGQFRADSTNDHRSNAAASRATPPPPGPAAATSAAASGAFSPAMRLRDQMVSQFRENDGEGIDPHKLERFTAPQFANYLERHQRSATSLLAVWQLTKDEAILREAFKRFDDPLIALHAFEYLGLTTEEKLAAAAKLEQTHPGSPIGVMLSGALLAKDGRSAEAIAKLQEAARLGPMSLGFPSQLLAQREALMSLGKTSLEARLQTTFALDMPHMAPSRALAAPAFAEVKSLLASGKTDAALALASEVITYARNLSAEPGHYVVNELNATSIEAGAVYALPPDVEIGDSGLTAAEYVTRLRKEAQFDVHASMHHLSRLDEAGLETYLQVLESQGDRAALRWAENYNGPAAPGAK